MRSGGGTHHAGQRRLAPSQRVTVLEAPPLQSAMLDE
jgi:hypothetical protein